MKGASVSFQLPYTCNAEHANHHRFGINRTVLTSDGKKLVSAGRDGCIKCWDISETEPKILSSLEEHIDWVNDLLLLKDRRLISASSDNTIMMWDIEEHKHLLTFRTHTDYVKSLSMASSTDRIFASGGLDGSIYIWDIEKLAATSVNQSTSSSYYPRKMGSQKQSIYSIAMNSTGTVLASGSSDKFIRVFDPRSGKRSYKLRGHQDNIRSVIMNDDGNLLVSASSDNSIKYWDLRQQRCLHTYYSHDDSVWTLQPLVQGEVDRFVSGGRDQNVFLIDAKRNECSNLLRSSHPILSASITPDLSNIWISTTDSTITKWDLNVSTQRRQSLSFSSSFSLPPGSPMRMKRKISSVSNTSGSLGDVTPSEDQSVIPETVPKAHILGSPGIIKSHILNNRRQVLAKDSSGNVTLWDVTTGKLVENYGIVDFQDQIEKLFEMQAIQNWFSVENKLGCLEITMDYPQCFNAEVYAIEAGFEFAGEEDKVNYGSLMIKSLFSNWLINYNEIIAKQKRDLRKIEKERKRDQKKKEKTEEKEGESEESSSDDSDYDDDDDQIMPQQDAKIRFNVDENVSVVIHHEKISTSSHPPIKKRIKDFTGLELPQEDIPKWAIENILRNVVPVASQKVGFYLESSDDKLKNLSSQHARLNAHRILRIRKVAIYVIQKLDYELPTRSEFERQKLEYETKTKAPVSTTQEDKEKVKAEEFLEILCNDKVLLPEHNLAIANTFYRNPSSSVITLHYRRRYPV